MWEVIYRDPIDNKSKKRYFHEFANFLRFKEKFANVPFVYKYRSTDSDPDDYYLDFKLDDETHSMLCEILNRIDSIEDSIKELCRCL